MDTEYKPNWDKWRKLKNFIDMKEFEYLADGYLYDFYLSGKGDGGQEACQLILNKMKELEEE